LIACYGQEYERKDGQKENESSAKMLSVERMKSRKMNKINGGRFSSSHVLAWAGHC